MNKHLQICFAALAIFLFSEVAVAQIPVEVFAGSKRATLDILFFRFFKIKEEQNSKFLFFNRNRAGIDYKMRKTGNLPQFGFTEAVSFNHEKLKGFAPVVVASVLNSGIYPKAGIQFVRIKKVYTVFSWLVCETLPNPTIDFFFLGRYTPKLLDELNLFTQIELVNAVPTSTENNFTFIQRIRLGLKTKEMQFGAGADVSGFGQNDYKTTSNIGGFLRYEF